MPFRITNTEKNRLEHLIDFNWGFSIVDEVDSSKNRLIRIKKKLEDDYECQFLIKKVGDTQFSCFHNTITNSRLTGNNNSLFTLDEIEVFLKEWVTEILDDLEVVSIDKSIERMKFYSPRFVSTYKHALTVVEYIDEESGGMILRKALEILFVDYFSFKLHSLKDVIIDQNGLGGMIDLFYGYNKVSEKLKLKESYRNKDKEKIDFNEEEINLLKEIESLIYAIREAKNLGNDFSHYYREFDNLTSKDFVDIIYHIVGHLNKEIDLNIFKGIYETSKEGLTSIVVK